MSRIPRPIIPRDLAKRVKFLANCGLIKPHYWTVATCQNTSLALEPINRIVPTTARASLACKCLRTRVMAIF